MILKHKFTFAIIILFLSGEGYSDIHYVSMNGTPKPPYTSRRTATRVIQKAVNAASSGDTVIVYDGVYNIGKTTAPDQTLPNRVMITKSITLKSAHGPKVTVIVGRKGVGKHNVRCLYARAKGEVRIIGFKIMGGGTIETEDSAYQDSQGAGMYVINSLVSNCIIIKNKCFNNRQFNDNTAGGIYAENSKIISCYVGKNQSQYGGGIYARNCYIYNCKFFKNRAFHSYYDWEYDNFYRDGDGGGLVLINSVVENCIIMKNFAAIKGGGILAGFNTKILNCKIIKNRTGMPMLCGYPPFGGAGITFFGGIISNSIIAGNIAKSSLQEYGGGVLGDEITIYNVIVKNNKALGGFWEGVGGGGIWGRGNVNVYNSLIYNNNTAGLEASAGGAQQCNLYNSIIVNNKTTGKDSWGGGVCFCNVINSIIKNNKAKEDSNYDQASAISFSCVKPLPKGEGNIDANPLFRKKKQLSFKKQFPVH